MRSWLEYDDTSVDDPEAEFVSSLVDADTPFWLDIEAPTDDVIDHLADALGLHPLAVEDSKEFDQRGKIVHYGGVVMVVGFGLDLDTGEPIEVHGYLTGRFIVTFRQRPSATIDRLHATGSMRELLGSESIRLVHHLTTNLHDDFQPYIARLEDRLAAIETAMLEEPLDEHLAEIAAIRQQADALRRTLIPGRDLAVRTTVAIDLPGTTSDAVLYASDIADELRLIVSDLGAIGDQCIAAMGLHTSLASNRQAAAGQQLAVVATIFLPITFVVGLFGMNFDVLVNDFEQGWPRFLIFGLGLNVACVAVTMYWLRRRGWR